MTATKTTYWLIETCGDNRRVWAAGDSLAAAKKQAGARHTVCTGSGLTDGQTLTHGAVQAAVMSGRVRVVDGSDATAFAGM